MPFTPDPRLPVDIVPSPNHGERRAGARPDTLVLHYTGMASSTAALRRLCAADSEVSAHYVVDEAGRIAQCVPEARRAWHAGLSSWAGANDINSRSIGIEIANPGHDFGYPDFPGVQTEAVVALCRDILARHPIPPCRVLAHSDIAPTRKQDPGEKFPWRRLHAAGVGHWIEPRPLDSPGDSLRRGDEGRPITALQHALARYGYGLPATGVFDEATEAVVRAFQRHFRPERVDGVADASTRATLDALQAALEPKCGWYDTPKFQTVAGSPPRKI